MDEKYEANEKIATKEEMLKKECGFYETTAKAYVDFDGRCGYCGQDLVEERFRYACGTIDHLIPRTVYPKGEWEQENMILSCSLCNALKRDYNPCLENETPGDALSQNREVLLQRAKEHIANKAAPAHANWWKVRMILRGSA